MCGFAGFIGNCGAGATHKIIVERMANAIRHRGPDSSGSWVDDTRGVALGHRRLSIVDLSPAGHQPMVSVSGRSVIVFNGEIYNFNDIRRDLESANAAPEWRGHCDTEVFLAAIEAWGVREALKRCVGMFAFALYDRETGTLTLARDRLGEKPLYWGRINGAFLFGSDLAALKQHPLWTGTINRDAIAELLRIASIPAPLSIYRDIFKLEPGYILELSASSAEPIIKPYWNAAEIMASGASNPFPGDASEAVYETERLLRQSLSGQMIADVPLGAFLSGGIDSSTVVALMQSMSPKPIKTFSIGFSELDYNEAPFAKAIAHHLGTAHTEHYVSAREAIQTIPELASIYSEPFADVSQIPTLLVSRLARRDVTVALSGDGGDECFAGYNRYTLAHQLWNKMRRVPKPVRAAFAKVLATPAQATWNTLVGPLAAILPPRVATHRIGEKITKGTSIAALSNLDEVYRALLSHWPSPDAVVIGGRETQARASQAPHLDAMRQMMLSDIRGYLPDDILVKVDRAAMSVGLETRVPLLDHRLVEFSATLPTSILRRDKQSKWPLREILNKHVPRTLVDRPKMGFGVPIDSWLRGPLREWSEDVLNETNLRRDGFFQPNAIRAAWAAHLSGRRNHQHQLWIVLMFQSWLAHETGGAG